MRMIAAAAFATATFFVPALASAQDAPAPSATAAAAPAATAPLAAPAATDSSGVNLDEVVCKQKAPTTGSRLGGGHECHTVREWNQRQLDSQNALEHQQQKGYAPTRRGG